MITSKDVPIPKEFRDAMQALPTAAGTAGGKMRPSDWAKGKIEPTCVCAKCLRSVPRTMLEGSQHGVCSICRSKDNT